MERNYDVRIVTSISAGISVLPPSSKSDVEESAPDVLKVPATHVLRELCETFYADFLVSLGEGSLYRFMQEGRMKKFASLLTLFLIFAAVTVLHAEGETTVRHDRLDGYAGPSWFVLFGSRAAGEAEGGVEVTSLGPLMFRLTDNVYLGPVIMNSESASEGPDTFLGGARLDGFIPQLSHGFYSTSLGSSVMVGATGINRDPQFTAQISAEVNANIHILPYLTFSAGPVVALRTIPGDVQLLPGFTFGLKESTPVHDGAIFKGKEDGLAIAGYWQGLWVFVNGTPAFIDSGGTRFELPGGLAVGAMGGMLRQEIREENSRLAIMLAGGTVGWNLHITEWLTLNPRVASGMEMFGWYDSEGNLDGGPHFMIRPELNAYIGILPFIALGGGVGYQFVTGEAGTAVPVDSMSSLAVNVQVRVGHR